MSFTNIRGALVGPIVSNSSFGLPWAFENVGFEPDATQPFGESFVLPNQPIQSSLGDSGTDVHDGVFQINLRYPSNKGTQAILAKSDEVATAYKSGTSLAYGGITVKTRSVGISPMTQEGAWFRITMNVEYYSFISRS